MEQDPFDSDSTVTWLSIEEQHAPAPRRLSRLLILAGALVLGLAVTGGMIVLLVRHAQSINTPSTVALFRDGDTLRRESVAAFREYDAARGPLPGIPEEASEERQAIQELIDTLQDCTSREDMDGFRDLVDHNRLMARLNLTGNLLGFSSLDKRYLRTQLKDACALEPYWTKLQVIKVLPSQDDPETRILYVCGVNEATSDTAEFRLLIGRNESNWKLYDWERLDLGMYESEEWSLYARLNGSSSMEGFLRWNELMDEAKVLMSEGDREEAGAKIREAESQVVPRELAGFRAAITGYLWQTLGDQEESERSFLNVSEPQETPGVYYGLMNGYRWRNPKEAIKYGKLYEETVGPTLDLCRILASLYEGENQMELAVEQWEQILRFDPEDVGALRSVLIQMPTESRSKFADRLNRLESPEKVVVSIAPAVGWEDPEALSFLGDYLGKRDAQAPATQYVLGLARQQHGEYEPAAEHFKSALDAEPDEEAAATYVYAYLEAMGSAGQIAEGWRAVAQRKAARDFLVDPYDEYLYSITNEELAQLAKMCRERFPDSLIGYYHLAWLALEDHRYEDAIEVLREGLATPTSEASEEEEYYSKDQLQSLLARALYETGQLQAAYELEGDSHERFLLLGRLATEERNWEQLQALIDLHGQHDSQDPWLDYCEAEITAGREQWEQAIERLTTGLDKASEDDKWSFKLRLRECFVESGRWLEHFRSSTDKKEEFEFLCERFLEDKNWEAMENILELQGREEPGDSRLLKYQAAMTWERADYRAFVRYASILLEGEYDDLLPSWRRRLLETQLLDALLKLQNLELARKMAQEKSDEDDDSGSLAIVAAASGDVAEAISLAKRTAERDENASVFYYHDEVGRLFLSERFATLQNDYPVRVPYSAAPVLAVLLSDQPWHLRGEDIKEALSRNDVAASEDPVSLLSLRADVERTFAVRTAKGGVWISTGAGKFSSNWRLDDPRKPLLNKARNCRYWLAVGTSALSSSQQERCEAAARMLAAEFAQVNVEAICVNGESSYERFNIYPASPELLTAWSSSGSMRDFQEQGLPIDDTVRGEGLLRSRTFEQDLRRAAQEYEVAPENRLEVFTCLTPEIGAEVLRLNVGEITYTYGSMQFEGKLVESSVLIPGLRKNLPLHLNLSQVNGFRLNSEEPGYRER